MADGGNSAEDASRTVTSPAAGAPGAAVPPVFPAARQDRHGKAGNPATDIAQARAWLVTHPDDADAICILGAALRKQGRFGDAVSHLALLVQSQAQMAQAWLELGLSLLGLGDRTRAAEALIRSLDLDPFGKEAWLTLGGVPIFAGSDPESPLRGDPRLAQATTALGERRWQDAEKDLRGLIASEPTEWEAINLLADLLVSTGRIAEAEALLMKCLEASPDCASARFRYITIRIARRDVRGLLAHIDRFPAIASTETLRRMLRAFVLFRNRQFDEAITEFESIVRDRSDLPGTWLEYANVLAAARNPGAVAAYEKTIDILPSFSEAYVAIANRKSSAMDARLAEHSRAQLARPGLPYRDRARFYYVQGKALENLGQYAESFTSYRAANDIQRGSGSDVVNNSDAYLRHAKGFFTPAFFAARGEFGSPRRDAIFIVGMPRSGTTLVEQILSSHSAVEAFGELTDLAQTGMRFAPDRPGEPFGTYPYVLKDLDAGRCRQIGDEYIATVRSRRAFDAPFFTDKLPGNFSHVGLIHLALPDATIIDVRRHPLDCCLSCFKHYFPAGMPQALDLNDIGRYYANYVELMAHFDAVLPGRMHRVIYEDLIANPEAEVRRLLERIGLPFEESCLRFHENLRPAQTVSADQVRQPLFAEGMGRWRNYEPWLEPLKAALGEVLEAYPAVPVFDPAGAAMTTGAQQNQPAASFVTGLRRIPIQTATRFTVADASWGKPPQ